MARSALQLVRRVPTLQAITLVYAEQHWSSLSPIEVKQKGVYDVCTVNENRRLRFTAEETGQGLFRPFSRRTTRTCYSKTLAQRVGRFIS